MDDRQRQLTHSIEQLVSGDASLDHYLGRKQCSFFLDSDVRRTSRETTKCEGWINGCNSDFSSRHVTISFWTGVTKRMNVTLLHCATLGATSLSQDQETPAAFPARWTIETWENIGWCDDSRFLMKRLCGRFRILTLNSTKAPIRATFPWPPLGPLGPVDGHFKGRCLPEYCRRLFPSIYAALCRFLTAPSNRITPLVTKLQSCFTEHRGGPTQY